MPFWSDLFSFEPPKDDTPDLPAPLPEGQVRLYLFSGSFADEAALSAYCFGSGDPDAPTDLTRGLPGAFVDGSYVITGFGTQVSETLRDFFAPEQADTILKKIAPHNSAVVMSEYAFGGFPFSLNDTELLKFHGAFVVQTKS